MRVGSRQSGHQHGDDEEKIALPRKDKGKGKKSSRGRATSKGEKDLSKVKCYACHKT